MRRSFFSSRQSRLEKIEKNVRPKTALAAEGEGVMEQWGTVRHSRIGRLGLRPADCELCAFRALLRRIQFLAVPQNPFRRIEQICSSEIWLFP